MVTSGEVPRSVLPRWPAQDVSQPRFPNLFAAEASHNPIHGTFKPVSFYYCFNVLFVVYILKFVFIHLFLFI